MQAMEGRLRELNERYGDDQQHTDELLRTCSRLKYVVLLTRARCRRYPYSRMHYAHG